MGEELVDGASSAFGPPYMTSDAVGDVGHDAEVVGDEEDSMPGSFAEAAKEGDDRAWVVTSSAVVGSSGIRSFAAGKRGHRDQGALAHPATEFMRVRASSPVGRRDPDGLQHLARPRPPAARVPSPW